MTYMRRPNRTCVTAGCPHPANPTGHCDECAATLATLRWKQHNPSRGKDYGSAEYRKARAAAISRDHGACLVCNARQLLQVHHINHNASDNRLANLATLCRTCHMGVEGEHSRGKPGQWHRRLAAALQEVDQ